MLFSLAFLLYFFRCSFSLNSDCIQVVLDSSPATNHSIRETTPSRRFALNDTFRRFVYGSLACGKVKKTVRAQACGGREGGALRGRRYGLGDFGPLKRIAGPDWPKISGTAVDCEQNDAQNSALCDEAGNRLSARIARNVFRHAHAPKDGCTFHESRTYSTTVLVSYAVSSNSLFVTYVNNKDEWTTSSRAPDLINGTNRVPTYFSEYTINEFRYILSNSRNGSRFFLSSTRMGSRNFHLIHRLTSINITRDPTRVFPIKR